MHAKVLASRPAVRFRFSRDFQRIEAATNAVNGRVNKAVDLGWKT